MWFMRLLENLRNTSDALFLFDSIAVVSSSENHWTIHREVCICTAELNLCCISTAVTWLLEMHDTETMAKQQWPFPTVNLLWLFTGVCASMLHSSGKCVREEGPTQAGCMLQNRLQGIAEWLIGETFKTKLLTHTHTHACTCTCTHAGTQLNTHNPKWIEAKYLLKSFTRLSPHLNIVLVKAAHDTRDLQQQV